MFCALFSFKSAYSQGSQTALNFDGANDFFDSNAGDLSATVNNFTMEFWYNASATITLKPEQNGVTNITGTTGNGQRYLLYPSHGGGATGAFGNSGAGVSVGTNAIQVYEHKSSYMPCLLTYSGPLINAGWNHVAIVYTAKQPTLYINGVFAKTGIVSNQNNVFPSSRVGGSNYGWYAGDIDELRIWNTSRSLAQIRDNMCKKLVGTEANLIRYHKMDDGAGTTSTDATGNQNGTLANMTPATDWIVSGAPIGDNSVHSYPSGGWNGTTLSTLTNPVGEDAIRISNMTGAPTGVHIYGVNQAPNVTCGAVGVGTNDRYFGVFVVGGTAPTYTLRYDYANSPYLNNFSSPNMGVSSRATNSNVTCSAWSDIAATNSIPTNSLTRNSLSGRNEFILTGGVTPLPIELIDFNARLVNDHVLLNWQTASELNNHFFTIERSKNGVKWEEVSIVNGAGNSNQLLDYTAIDEEPYSNTSYYRLKQTDFDGNFSYSDIKVISANFSKSDIFIYPNPANGAVTILGDKEELKTVRIYTILGQDLTETVEVISLNETSKSLDLTNLSPGMYTIKTSTTVNTIYCK